ncbi:MAG: gliding motility protein GldN [Prevotellaceae bacterium]|jgi:gliding motility associated protien GldN|nr:gliding motility protein GldN [Prevotellaceae bacterium]
MKRISIAICCLSALLLGLAVTAKAQSNIGRTATPGDRQPQASQGGSATASKPGEHKRSLATDGLFNRQTIATKEPMPYPRIREADVIWSKRIWRVIDLREKLNLPLYYPTMEMALRKSLIQTLVEAVRSGELRAFDPDEDDEFTTLITPEDLSKKFDAIDKTVKRAKMDGTGDTTIVERGEYNWEQVREILIKEDWFFDKHYSKMFVRIVGICPIRVYKKPLQGAGNEDDEGEEQKKQLFWVSYDEARPVLARTPSYVPNNDATNLSFDDVFNARRFSSYIQKESNAHNNRSVATYTPNGYAALLESERIKNSIMTWEHDLWEY